MADEKVDLNTLKQLQAELLQAAADLSKERNGDKLVEGAKALQRRGQHLTLQAERFAAQERARHDEPPRGNVRVALTPDQRQRIAEATGVQMDELVMEDVSVTTSEMMPYMEPTQIELMALRQAERKATEERAAISAREQLRGAFSALEGVDNAEHKKVVSQLKKDPNFLGGALQD